MGRSLGLGCSTLPGPSMSGFTLQKMEGLVGRVHLTLSIKSRHLFNLCLKERRSARCLFGMGHLLAGMIPVIFAVLQPCSSLCY